VNARHLQTLRAIQVKALQALQVMPLDSGMDAVRALDTAIRQERVILGEPGERSAVSVEEGSPAPGPQPQLDGEHRGKQHSQHDDHSQKCRGHSGVHAEHPDDQDSPWHHRQAGEVVTSSDAKPCALQELGVLALSHEAQVRVRQVVSKLGVERVFRRTGHVHRWLRLRVPA